ncbi:T6SS immunity protein Tli4 family protein [Massilia sp.]|uniref:T6SS immunity protein Tli4 family protein n=1 Tax=Massilia sp. TaxID=1882437 RepID=UPI0028987CC4|nr:T6SS immunity protein Tli4 family protein [Massilia sp.]
MKSWFRSRLAKMLAGALLAGLAATWAVGKAIDKREVDRRDQHKVALMTDKMKTVCVGRFLIDLPEEAQVELGRASIDGFDISGFHESEDEFHKRLADREAQLGAKPDWRGGNKNLEVARDVKTSSGLAGKIFFHSRTVEEGTRGNGLGGVERYRYEGISTEALVHGHGISIDLFFEDRRLDWLEDLPRLVEQLVTNPHNRIPAEPGFCMDRLYIREPLRAEQREQIMMSARLPSHPDVEIMFILGAGVKPSEHGLLARSDAADAKWSIADLMRVTRLRGAPREIGGLAGEELVERVVEVNEARVHSFWWEVDGTEDNVLVPHLVFRMTTGVGRGKPVPSSLSDGAALGLWDKITSSIRLRPTQPAEISHGEAPATPLGTYATAGERCPESGWWLCSDGGDGIGVLGGQRQYIRKGDTVPQALLLPPRTLWDKVRGVQPSFESKNVTFWKLVDKRSQKRAPPSPALALPVAPFSTAIARHGVAMSDQSRVSVGSFAVTGTPCPASGWWRCEQSHALDSTRWFAQGTLLPPATFAVSPGVFGRSTNVPKTIRRRGEWRLVRLADEPGQSCSDAPGAALETADQSVRHA